MGNSRYLCVAKISAVFYVIGKYVMMLWEQGVGRLVNFFYHVGKVSEFPIWQKQLSHCGGGEHVAVTTRRRRRILQAGFFFTL